MTNADPPGSGYQVTLRVGSDSLEAKLTSRTFEYNSSVIGRLAELSK